MITTNELHQREPLYGRQFGPLLHRWRNQFQRTGKGNQLLGYVAYISPCRCRIDCNFLRVLLRPGGNQFSERESRDPIMPYAIERLC
jgi:hypothetical protein